MTDPIFEEQIGSDNPFDTFDVGDNAAPTFIDMDKDGDEDAIVGDDDYPYTLKFYRNNNSTFVEVTGANNPFDGKDVGNDPVPSFMDIDGDGDKEAIVGNYDGTFQFYLNKNGIFDIVTGTGDPLNDIDVGYSAAPIFLDMDQDGDEDLIAGNSNGNLKFYRNNNASFVEVTGAYNPFKNIDVGDNAAPAFMDMDKDGDQDLILGNEDGYLLYYQNNNGQFVELTDDNPLWFVDVGDNAKPAVTDLDGDGDEDVVVGNGDGKLFYFKNLGENNEIVGTAGSDILYGTFAANVIKGQAGDDALIGEAGNDTLDGGTGADILIGGIGDDVYRVENAGDVLLEAAGEGKDTIESNINYTLNPNVEKLILKGNTNINGTGNAANNTLIGNTKNNTLNGGAGNDTIKGGGGNDKYIVDAAGDKVIENANQGSDIVETNINYTLPNNVEQLILTGNTNLKGTGNALANIITGNAKNNILNGGAGKDQLLGKAGQDTLIGGAGNDTLTGGGDGDIFEFKAPTEGVDTFKDFVVGLDKIKISLKGFDLDLLPGDLPADKFVLGAAAKDSDDRFIYNSSNGSLYFDNNGSANGGMSQLAILEGAPSLTANSILVL